MGNNKRMMRHRMQAGTFLVAMAVAGGARAELNLPSLGEDDSPWDVHTTYENHTVNREGRGLAKFRNTIQSEFSKRMGSGWTLGGTLRGTWDGVYRMNSSEYGRKAGGGIKLQDSALGTDVPFGSGSINNASATAMGLVGNAFGFDSAANPNRGLEVLGNGWHGTNGDLALGVPVRPCDVDKRGCRDFGGYGNQSTSDLEFPEFNSRLDFVRELHVKNTLRLGDGNQLFLKVGKQQIVWGRTDLFRVLDVVNPVDFSRNNIYDELSDIRIPMWIAQAEFRMGASERMQDRNLQFFINFDKFRANNLGQCGTANVILDAGCLFRSLANLWDNGGTVANFAPAPTGSFLSTDFGPHQAGIRNVHLPSWSLANMPVGVKYEGVTMGGLAFSLNAMTYRSQMPSLRGINGNGTVNPFSGQNGNIGGEPVKGLIAFDMHFPRINLIGGSLDFQIPAANAAVRMEAALTEGEEFANTAKPNLYSSNNVFRSVIGIDRPTFIPFISKSTATLISGQLFYQHIFNHELYQGPLGKFGMPDWEDNVIGTLLIRASLRNGTVSPQLIMARDFRAKAFAISPQVEWNIRNELKLTIGANYKSNSGDYRFDDCRSCNPYPPFTNGGNPAWGVGQSLGLGGVEPLGRFRAGPIGTAFGQNDVYVRLNYKF